MLKHKTKCLTKGRTVAIRGSKHTESRDFPGGPRAKTSCSQCRGWGSIPGQGSISHMPRAAKKMNPKKTIHSLTVGLLKGQRRQSKELTMTRAGTI